MLQSLCLLGSLKDESSFFLFHIRFNVNSVVAALPVIGGAVFVFIVLWNESLPVSLQKFYKEYIGKYQSY